MSMLDDFLRKNATSATLIRAREIVNKGYIKSMHFNENARKISANVQGNSLYSVQVIFTGQKKLFTNCGCPYNYGGICKHTAAVLMRFQQHHGDISFVANTKPAIISNFKNINTQDIFEITDAHRDHSFIEYIASYVHLLDYEGGDSIQFETQSEAFSYNKPVVSCTKTTKGMEMKCSCESDRQFCDHMIAVLYFGVENKGLSNYFEILDPKFREEKILSIGKSYGIEQKQEALKHISITTRDNELAYTFSDKYDGLLPVEQDQLDRAKTMLFQNSNLVLDPENLLPEAVTEPVNEKFGFGVVLSFDIETQELVYTDCFTAKYNKKGDRLLSKFHTLALEDHPDVSEKQKVILELASSLDTSDKYNDSSLRNLHKTQPILRSLVQNLESDTFTYYQEIYPAFGISQDFRKSNLQEIKLKNNFYQITYELEQKQGMISLIPLVVLPDRRIRFDWAISNGQDKLPLFFRDEMSFYLAQDLNTLSMMEDLLVQPIKKMKDIHIEEFLKEIVLPLSDKFTIEASSSVDLNIKRFKLKPMQKKLYISDLGQFVLFRPYVKYSDDVEFNILKKGTHTSYEDGDLKMLQRAPQYEALLNDLIRELHPKFKKQFPEDFFYLKIDEMTQNHWFFDAFEKLVEADVEVLGLNELKHFRYNPYKPSIQTHISSGLDWFDVQLDIKFGDMSVSLQEVKKAIQKQDRYVKLSDGSVGILPAQWLERFSRMFRHGDVKGDQLKISSRKFLIIDELFEQIDDLEVHKDLLAKKKKLKNFSAIRKVKVPAAIKAELRPYQKEGLNWLNFLKEFGWGGILADDMGLGKTVQILSFLASAKQKNPNLIVVPTTLMFNWENEIEKFCPSIKAHFHYGPNREKSNKLFKGHNAIITTYGIVANDIEWLKDEVFNYVILDESQAIKNPQSLRFKSVNLLKAAGRLALTGTPIENNTFDLYAQMHFVNPGMLGNMKSFKDQFSQPIDRDGDSKRAAELRTLISPFIIRRTKEQVAKELPPKTEDVIFCTMDKEQRKVYEAFRNKYRNLLMGKIDEDGLEKSKIYVIEGLMKLRQICDSPELLSDEENYGTASIKVEELMRNIEEKTGDHKIVVFSQFVSMLSLIRRELDRDEVVYEYLDGKSSRKARQQSVERFQEDQDCRVFLISLKAGGTGLNLTAADYVFLVDPWWNPAVEEQAIDRTYRIGQDKKVFAYRMICKDTIEEKIIKYQQRKKAVAADIIQAEESFMKQLSSQDIQDLFS